MRPEVSSIHPSLTPTQSRQLRPRFSALRPIVVVAMVGIAVVTGAALLVPHLLTPAPSGTADSPFYETFDGLSADSTMVVAGTVEVAGDEEVDGIAKRRYDVTVTGSTVEGTGPRLSVFITVDAAEIEESTAETEQLQTGEAYVLALVPFHDDWQLTSVSGQSAFAVEGTSVGASLDGSLTVPEDVAKQLSLTVQ